MPKCPKCGENKETTAFYKNSSRASGHASWCKVCTITASKKYYYDNQEEQQEKALKRHHLLFKANVARLKYYLGGFKCKHCGVEDDCFAIYDLHHIDPATKEGEPTKMLRLVEWEEIQEEVDKCILLCANCHRREHRCK